MRTRDGRANGQDGSPTARRSVCGPRELWRMVDEMIVAGQQANERRGPPKPALATAQSPATRQAVNGTANADSFDLAFEDPEYLCRQLITYIGNKRALLGQIGAAVEAVKRRLGKPKLRVFDVFSGSGVVSRYLKAHASYLASNDIEDYAATIVRCYLRNRSTVDFPRVCASGTRP